jgi:hypothetical protein
MVSSLILPFPAMPWLPFLSHIFSIAGSKQSGEGAESRARVVGAFIGAKAQTLDSAPALGTLPGEKMGDFSRCFLFNTFTRARPPRLPTITRSRGFSFLAACFLEVRAREPVNRPFFAPLPPTSLTPHALTHVNRKFACSSLLGVTCHTLHPLRSSARF